MHDNPLPNFLPFPNFSLCFSFFPLFLSAAPAVVSRWENIPLRYDITYLGNRSSIVDENAPLKRGDLRQAQQGVNVSGGDTQQRFPLCVVVVIVIIMIVRVGVGVVTVKLGGLRQA